MCDNICSLKNCMVGKPRRGQWTGKKEGILLVMHWYKHPAFKYPLIHRCGRTETKGRNSLTFETPFSVWWEDFSTSGVGKVLKVLISSCRSLKVNLVLPFSLNMTLHLESALHPHELMYCPTEWGWTDHATVARKWLCKNSSRFHLVWDLKSWEKAVTFKSDD